MPKKPQRTTDDEAQSKRFIDAARKAEADETEEVADRVFKKIAPIAPKPPKAAAK